MAMITKPKQPSPTARYGMLSRIRRWAQEVWLELQKVIKPTPQETTRMMIAVLGISLIFTVWLGVLDLILTYLTSAIEQKILSR